MMALFSAFGGNFLSIALIVFHSLVGSDLWCSIPTICFRWSLVVLVGSLDLRSSRALFSNISAGTGSVVVSTRVWCDAAFRMMVCKICSPFWQLVGSHLFPHSLSSIGICPLLVFVLYIHK